MEKVKIADLFSKQLIGVQDIADVLPDESLIELTQIAEPDIAKEQNVEAETQEYTEPATALG